LNSSQHGAPAASTESAALPPNAASFSSGGESPHSSRQGFRQVGSVLRGAIRLPQATKDLCGSAATAPCEFAAVLRAPGGVGSVGFRYDRVDAIAETIQRTCHSVRTDPQNPVPLLLLSSLLLIRNVEPWGDREGNGVDSIYDRRKRKKIFKPYAGSRTRTESSPGSLFTSATAALCDPPAMVVPWIARASEVRRVRARRTIVVIGDGPLVALPLGHRSTRTHSPLTPSGAGRRSIHAIGWSRYDWNGTNEGHLFHVSRRDLTGSLARSDRPLSSATPGAHTLAHSATQAH